MCKKYGKPLSRTAHRATKNQEKNEKERKGKKKTKEKKTIYCSGEGHRCARLQTNPTAGKGVQKGLKGS